MQNLEPQQLIGAGTLFRNLQPHEAAAIIARLQSASYVRGYRILSLSLAQTNQQILANHSAERVWLSFIHDPGKPLELSLAVHVAGALAVRSRQRVLMLELCGQDQALGPHVAVD